MSDKLINLPSQVLKRLIGTDISTPLKFDFFINKAKAERKDLKFMTMISSNCPGDICSVF